MWLMCLFWEISILKSSQVFTNEKNHFVWIFMDILRLYAKDIPLVMTIPPFDHVLLVWLHRSVPLAPSGWSLSSPVCRWPLAWSHRVGDDILIDSHDNLEVQYTLELRHDMTFCQLSELSNIYGMGSVAKAIYTNETWVVWESPGSLSA